MQVNKNLPFCLHPNSQSTLAATANLYESLYGTLHNCRIVTLHNSDMGSLGILYVCGSTEFNPRLPSPTPTLHILHVLHMDVSPACWGFYLSQGFHREILKCLLLNQFLFPPSMEDIILHAKDTIRHVPCSPRLHGIEACTHEISHWNDVMYLVCRSGDLTTFFKLTTSPDPLYSLALENTFDRIEGAQE